MNIFNSKFDSIVKRLYVANNISTVSNKSNFPFVKNNTVHNKSCLSFFSAIRTKPFLLFAGISGTGKSRIVRRLAQATTNYRLEGCSESEFEKNRWNLHKPTNFEIIQVKPNWHNSMDVVGYQTNIPTPRYVFTPFVEFIAKAWLNPTVPFFLCLDEMNLAPVEEYFAEFLSAIESRSKKEKVYETDPIIKPFTLFGEEICKKMLKTLFPDKDIDDATESPLREVINRFKTKGLTLPENLIVIGTVNMDETTFSFSRKVLDRAMSFEMNEVDYDSFLMDAADVITRPLTQEESELLINRFVNAKDVKDEIDASSVIEFLKTINEKLDNTSFKLGYRAANEAILYVAAAKRFGQENIAIALDEFTTMKILSRIEGDTTKLRVDDKSDKTILDEMQQVLENMLKPIVVQGEQEKQTVQEEQGQQVEKVNITSEKNIEESQDVEPSESDLKEKQVVTSKPVELKSLDKIHRMKEQLKRNSFVSYWD